MKKQIFYPNFIPRIFSTAVDMCILSVVFSPVMGIVQKQFFLWKFKPYLISHGIDASDSGAIYDALNSPDFQSYMTLGNFLSYTSIVLFVQAVLMGTYFIYFWSQKSWTPGKYITGMRVLDETTLEKMTVWQGVKRFLGTALFPVSILFILFSDKRQSLHDRIAGTVVIKR